MTKTEWFVQDRDGVTLDPKTGAYVTIFPNVPDWVALPPEIGGTRHRVVDSWNAPCPRCQADSQTLRLDNDMYVSVCRDHENPYCFYTRRTPS